MEETLGGDKYVYGIGGGDGLRDGYVSANSSNCIHLTCRAFYMSIIHQ